MEVGVPEDNITQDNEIDSQTKNTPNAEKDTTDETSRNSINHTKSELDAGYRVLTDIVRQNRSTCLDFLDEVDAEGLGLWDYQRRIKKPMWLNKMIEKFNSYEYVSITEFVQDFRLMVENCYRYNGTDHVISKKARRLELLLEGKLALLHVDIRLKTSIQVTSNGKYTVDNTAEELQPYHVASRSTSRLPSREYTATGEELKLVYDFVRCEEFMLTADNGKMTHRERRQQETLYRQLAGNWITKLHTPEFFKDIKTCHLLPEIGFFMHLSQSVMKFPNLSMYILERCLLMPKQSAYLSKIMSSLLCSYSERSLLQHRPPMQYRTWHARLVERINKWFDKAFKHRSFEKAVDKCNLTMEFFEAMEWKNPFSNPDTCFTDLSYTKRAHIIKALCENLSCLQSIQTLFNNADPLELQCMRLGYDLDGNVYIYFPQFCGDDVRLYRHKQHNLPRQTDNVPTAEEIENLLSVSVETSGSKASVNAEEIKQLVSDVIDRIELQAKTKIYKKDSQVQNEEITINNETQVKQEEEPLSECKNSLNNFDNVESKLKKSSRTPQSLKHCQSPKEMGTEEPPIIPPEVRRSSRKRSSVVKMTMSPEKPKPKTPKSKRSRQSKTSKPVQKQAPKERFGSVEFELLCEDVSDIHNLISKLEAMLENADLSLYTKAAKVEMADLIEQVQWLLGELKPFDGKMTRAKVENQIKMKKEFDELSRDAAIGKHIPDPWCDEDVPMIEQPDPTINSYLEEESRIGRKRRSPIRYSDGEDERDISDEDYIPDVTSNSRHFVQIPKIEYDYSLYEFDRVNLLPAALDEMRRILSQNIKLVMKITNRSALRESAMNDRKTRLKSKSENKVVQRLLLLTEACVKERPSLIPILVPLPEVVEIVDLLLTEEDFAKREAHRARQAKKNCVVVKKQRLAVTKTDKEKDTMVDDLENIVVDKEIESNDNLNKNTKKNGFVNKKVQRASSFVSAEATESVICRMSNGKQCHGVKLKDGTIIPIARPNDSPPANTVSELIKNLNRQTQQKAKQQNTVPHISLRSPPKGPHFVKPKTIDANLRNSAALGLVNLQNGNHKVTPVPRFTTTSLIVQKQTQPQQKVIQVQLPAKRGVQILPTNKIITPVKYVLPVTNNLQQVRLQAPSTIVTQQKQPQLRYVAPVVFANNQHRNGDVGVLQPASIATQNIIVQQQIVTVQAQNTKQVNKNASN